MALITPVILCGGAGTRLWPASRAGYPKQLLPLNSDKTMLQETAMRFGLPDDGHAETVVVCNERHRFLVAEQLLEIDVPAIIILEPQGRNTAPAIALAALSVLGNDPGDQDALLLVMPADHVIADVVAFRDAVQMGVSAAEDGKLVTFGVVPTEANTGYGYIEAESSSTGIWPIISFQEKPEADVAEKFLAGGQHLWNAGIFLFSARQYLAEIERHEPDIAAACKKSMTVNRGNTDFVRIDAEEFARSPSISIDYAVMEHTNHGVVIPISCGWSDVGSWAALHDVLEKDSAGNVTEGDVVTHNCSNSLISSKNRLVTVVGLDDVVVVEDKDAVLVASKKSSQDVKAIVDKLKADSREETELHRQVFRPWGSYDSIDSDDGFQVKRLIVNPGAVLSLQKHAHRAEHWTVVRGVARITLDDEVFDLGVNESTYIPIGAVHRIANESDEPVHIIEVQCGDYLGEDDIIRFEDNYGREGTNT